MAPMGAQGICPTLYVCIVLKVVLIGTIHTYIAIDFLRLLGGHQLWSLIKYASQVLGAILRILILSQKKLPIVPNLLGT